MSESVHACGPTSPPTVHALAQRHSSRAIPRRSTRTSTYRDAAGAPSSDELAHRSSSAIPFEEGVISRKKYTLMNGDSRRRWQQAAALVGAAAGAVFAYKRWMAYRQELEDEQVGTHSTKRSALIRAARGVACTCRTCVL